MVEIFTADTNVGIPSMGKSYTFWQIDIIFNLLYFNVRLNIVTVFQCSFGISIWFQPR